MSFVQFFKLYADLLLVQIHMNFFPVIISAFTVYWWSVLQWYVVSLYFALLAGQCICSSSVSVTHAIQVPDVSSFHF